MIEFVPMTELDDILANLVDQVDGATAAAVGSMDGLLIDQSVTQGQDLSALLAELTNLLTGGTRALGSHVAGGNLRELILTGEELITYVRVLGSELFCVIVMEAAGGNLGKARLYAGQASRHIVGALE
jgi:predicted regulator of Ras-like GTPase activity (Roadblock/LC7/MglB family)